MKKQGRGIRVVNNWKEMREIDGGRVVVLCVVESAILMRGV